MQDYQIKNFMPRPFIPVADTNPPQIIDLKFRLATTYINDGWMYGFDTVEISFAFEADEMKNRSEPKMYHLDIEDLDTGARKGYIIMAADRPYMYWQRAAETEPGMEDSVEGGIINGRVYITPINDFGQGPTSSFLMPMKDLLFIDRYSINRHSVSLVLASYWELFSLTPETKFNRPKSMHIYMDVSIDDVLLDKEELSKDEYAYNTIGNWNDINQQMYRWVINKGPMQKLNELDQFVDLTEKESEFIVKLLDSFNEIYRFYLNSNRIPQGNPHVFKLAVMNPRDHDDSIIIYFMKGKRWEI